MTTSLPPEIEKQIAELITSYETAMAKIAAREKMLDDQFELAEHFLNEKIEKINGVVMALRDVMTESGAARLRLSMQESLKLGSTQLETLKKINTETQTLISESCTRFEKTSYATVRNVHAAVHAFKIDDLKYLIQESHEQIKDNARKTINDVSKNLRFFHWKNIILALGLSLVVAVLMGLYMNAEWPWEVHQTVVKERAAGKALMNAWPHLNQDDQAFLQDKILKVSQQ